MAVTVVGVGDPKAVKRYSAFLAVDVAKESYFNRKFMGVGEEAHAPLQTLPHLENDAGDEISYDLVMQLKMQPVEGDATLRGKEEDLKFYTDSVKIDQMRGGVNSGGRMSRKRTVHDLRKIARVRQSEWWARLFDELLFMYLAGARGANKDYILPVTYAGFAGNALVAPDQYHRLYADNAGSVAANAAAISSSHKMNLGIIDRAVTRATTMGGGVTGVPQMAPIRINGEDHFVIVMHPLQEQDLRTASGTGQWLDIQKAAAAAEGRANPIFKGTLGMYRNVVLHSHKSVIRFASGDASGDGSNFGAAAARALFLGRQAGVVAFGSPGTGLRFGWTEETEDRGNQVVITTDAIFGVKKTSFTTAAGACDFGVMALNTYVDVSLLDASLQ